MVEWWQGLTAVVTVFGPLVGWGWHELTGRIQDNTETIEENASDIDDHKTRLNSIEQLLIGKNGDEGELERARQQREQMLSKMDELDRQSRITLYSVADIQQALDRSEEIQIDFERIDLRDDFFRGSQKPDQSQDD